MVKLCASTSSASTTTTRLAALAAVAVWLPMVHGHAHEGVGFHISHEERAMNEPFFNELRARYGVAPAQVINNGQQHMQHKRQTVVTSASSRPASSASTAAGTGLAGLGTASAGAGGASVSMGTIPIGTATTAGATSPLPTTFLPGATNAVIAGAPTLPNGE